MTHNTENNSSTPNNPTSGWVWHCTDTSIAAKQISALAAVEIVLAVGVYWWLTLQFEWPLMAFISMVAAPILLLRSNESIALGVKLLRAYWVPGYKKNISDREKIFIFMIIATTTVLVSYWIVTYGLADCIGWSLFWCVAKLIISFLLVAFVITISIAGPGAFMGRISNSVIFKILFNFLLFPLLIVGLLIRGLFIRFYATLRHPLSGLGQLPQNWRETLLVIDILHLPELLPQASTVDPTFGVEGAWAMQQKFNWPNRIIGSAHIIALYIPALIYRLSLKASAWLWFPISLALTPPLYEKKSQDSRRLMAILYAWQWQCLIIAVIGILWLLSATPWLETWLPLLPAEYAIILTNLPTLPAFGLRYTLACLGCLLIILLRFKSINLKASHGPILESPNGLNALSQQDQLDFLSLAKSIDKIRLLLIATLILWGELMAIGFFHAQYPDIVERFISPALLLYL